MEFDLIEHSTQYTYDFFGKFILMKIPLSYLMIFPSGGGNPKGDKQKIMIFAEFALNKNSTQYT